MWFMKKEYNNEAIRKLRGPESIRLRPESMLGSNGLDGTKHTVIEIIGNSTDEGLSGYGDKLIISLYDDGAISVRDFGRGVPLGWNKNEEEWNYVLIFEDLYAGGKYDNNQEVLKNITDWDNFKIEDYPYLVSIGLNGLGATATQFSSEYFEVVSYRDGKASRMLFEKGIHILDELEITDSDEPTGTFIKWKPDDEVFTDTKIPSKWLDKLCESLSYVAGFDVTFNNKGKIKEYKARTYKEVMIEKTGNCIESSKFTHTEDTRGDVCICQSNVCIGSVGLGTEFYQNRVSISGGVHARAVNTSLAIFFADVVSKDYGIKFREADYSGRFSFIISTLTNKMSIRGQTKDSMDDIFVMNNLIDCIFDLLSIEYAKGTQWLTDIINEVVEQAKNRIAIAEMSKNLKEIEKSTKKYKPSRKFVSCETYEDGKAEETECFIVEGDSAGGRVLTARSAKFQCYLAIRGKSLNVYKASIADLLNNREIKDMIAMLGCGIDLGLEEYQSFDMSKLKVGKIIFLADADIDGKHICMLLFLIFWKLFPELLYEGKVYICETPLYVINCMDNTSVYCMDEAELEEQRNAVGKDNIRSIDRFKGLGETDEDTLWNTTLDPQKRRLRQIKLERGDVELQDALEILFGKSTDRRKSAILGSMMGDYEGTMSNIDSLVNYVNSLNLNEDLELKEVSL